MWNYFLISIGANFIQFSNVEHSFSELVFHQVGKVKHAIYSTLPLITSDFDFSTHTFTLFSVLIHRRVSKRREAKG